MVKRLIFILAYSMGWILLFSLFRILFYAYQYALLEPLAWQAILASFYYGLPLDLSFAAYISAIPVLLIAFSTIFSAKVIKPIIKGYSVLVTFFVVLIQTADLELFRSWGFRIDNTPLKYLNTPAEMWASSAASPILLLVVIFILCTAAISYTYIKLINRSFHSFPKGKIYHFPVFLLILGALIIPIRGGLQLAPINQSVAYFSTEDILNQGALNAPWVFMHSVVASKGEPVNPFVSMEMEEARQLIEPLYARENMPPQLLKGAPKKPNVVLIIWESFTANTVAKLGGLQGITPKFDKLSAKGVLIDGMYASASRSDKGLVAILSGYPSQGDQSIMKIPNKTMKLPGLARDFKNAGYGTSYYYGGELEFANMKSYLVNSGFEKLYGKDSFDEKDMNSKWGAHDHVVFDKLLNDLKTAQEPFFTTLFTLSSHEPFEVPVENAFEGTDERTKFLNSIHYTDQALYDFLENAKKLPSYANTLFLIVADHGHRLPENVQQQDPEKYEIPMLWYGELLNSQDSIVHRISSQTDIARTLLNELQMDASAYEWSRNLFNKEAPGFALATMKNGFIWMDSLGAVSYDYNAKNVIYSKHPKADSAVRLGKAHLQLTFQDYLNK